MWSQRLEAGADAGLAGGATGDGRPAMVANCFGVSAPNRLPEPAAMRMAARGMEPSFAVVGLHRQSPLDSDSLKWPGRFRMAIEQLGPVNLRDFYVGRECRNVPGVLATTCPREWVEIMRVLRRFRRLRYETMAAGRNPADLATDRWSLLHAGMVGEVMRYSVLWSGLIARSIEDPHIGLIASKWALNWERMRLKLPQFSPSLSQGDSNVYDY